VRQQIEERRQVHEYECAAAVVDAPTVRRRQGRWQVLRDGKWRDLDPVVELTAEAVG
jgi:hypothetical protein